MSNVVAINGAEIVAPGEIDEKLVELLERHLENAKAGRSTAVAVCSVDQDGWVLGEFDMNKHRFTLLGALVNLTHRLNEYVEEGDA